MSYFIILRGPLGSGKTTVAEHLAKEIGAKHIALDAILEENGLTIDKEDGYISQKSFIKANTLTIDRALPLLQAGTPVILDGNFYWRSQVDDLLERLSFRHHVFTLKVPLSVCIERDSKRSKPHGKDATEVVYAKTTEFDYGVSVDASGGLVTVLKQIKLHLKL